MGELNLRPGPIIGQLLEDIREGQATGRISTREEALDFARVQLKEIENQ
jgi:poly(A) polymerase/tRNA nucleotidyltransferase (CCA-adding enzyme)